MMTLMHPSETKPSITDSNTTLAIAFPTTMSLEDLCQALAEGEHHYGREITRTAYAVIQWPGADYGTVAS